MIYFLSLTQVEEVVGTGVSDPALSVFDLKTELPKVIPVQEYQTAPLDPYEDIDQIVKARLPTARTPENMKDP